MEFIVTVLLEMPDGRLIPKLFTPSSSATTSFGIFFIAPCSGGAERIFSITHEHQNVLWIKI